MTAMNQFALAPFTTEDQEWFARLSGDRNPIHMSADAARRTPFGEPVVHGVHVVLRALDGLCAMGAPSAAPTSLKVRFLKPILLGRPLSWVRSEDRQGTQLKIFASDVHAVTVRIGATVQQASTLAVPSGSRIEVGATPDAHGLSDLEARTGHIVLDHGRAEAARLRYPDLCREYGAATVMELAGLSTLVGMVVPGLHSIFSSFDVSFEPQESACPLAFAVRSVDSRFRLLVANVRGSRVVGSLEAFVRFPPIEPPTVAEVRDRVAQGEFADRRALVVGGSRGLGAVTAQILALGGADVTITYARGKVEAEALVAELDAAGAGPVRSCRHVAGEIGEVPVHPDGGGFTHVYYFATPPIFADRGAAISAERFRRFCAVYVDGFLHIAQGLIGASPSGALHMLYPSSVAVTSRPPDMTEYAMAKAAGEILCQDLTARHKGLVIATPRLPRLNTDQTATVPPAPADDPLPLLLGLVRDA